MTYLELETRIRNAKQLDFGSLFDNIIELFKKIWLKGFITILLIMASALSLMFVFSIIGLSPQNVTLQQAFSLENFYNSYYSNIIYGIPQTILIGTLTMAFLGAFYRMCKQVVSGEAETDDYFYFFKKEYFSKVFMLGIIYSGIAIVAQLVFIIPYIYVFIPLSFFAVVLAHNPDLGEIEIVKISFKLGNKKWFITFLTMFVAGILGMLGILACGIGLLFTMSIVYLPAFFIYKEVVGFGDSIEDNVHNIDDISGF
ncbi:hypothetical protein [Bizionia arctica]|uniref:Beta-carotene 15,15'-monooxygenase n=1 Tax=Bizionia arctica TaxID=1495645 RepID=A0A917G9W1_9FLAO|nr:hypothetical protein [Bizionia arctica]GGG32381.1 hypothetical protein GCM10010976_00220 [Bizionia arctica]